MAGPRADIMAGRAYVSLFVKSSAFETALRKAKDNLAKFGADIQALGRQILTMGAAIGVPLALAAKRFADFDDAMRAVKAVTGSTEQQLASLTSVAKELGRTTSFTALEVGSLMTELGRAGFSPAQIEAMTGAVLDLARATGTDATLASGIMAASIRQFGLAATDSVHVADALTTAANKSFNTVEQLGEALSYAGPVARDFNLSLDDTLAILGGLGNAGIQASNAGTALRRLLTIGGAEAAKLQNIFGVAFVDIAGNARPLVDVLGEVNDATEGLGTAARAQKFSDAFGLLGITGASVIGRSVGDIRQLSQAISESEGAAKKASQEMDGGFGGAIRKILSAADVLAISLGEQLAPQLQAITKFGTDLLGVATKFVEKNQKAIVSIAKFAAGLVAAGAAMIALGSAASFAAFVLGGLLATIALIKLGIATLAGAITFGFGLALSPIVIITAAITAIGAAVLYSSGAFGAMLNSGREALAYLSSAFGPALSSIRETIVGSFSAIQSALSSGNLELAGNIAITALKLIFAQGMDAIATAVGGAFGATIATLTSQIASGDMTGAWLTVISGMQAIWENFTAGIVNVFVDAASSVTKLWRDTVDGITNYVLQKASQGGIFGKAFEMLTGVNIQDELAKENSLNQQLSALGANGQQSQLSSDIQNGTYKDPGVAAAADAAMAQLESLRTAQNDAAASANEAFAARVSGGSSAINSEIGRLKKELDSLKAQADSQAEDAKKEPVPGGDQQGGAGSGGITGLSGKASVATFSAAAAIAQFTRGGPADQQLKITSEMKKGVDRSNELLAQSVDATKNIGLRFT